MIYRKLILILIFINSFLVKIQSNELKKPGVFRKHETTQPHFSLIIYSADWCPPCHKLKKDLEKNKASKKIHVVTTKGTVSVSIIMIDLSDKSLEDIKKISCKKHEAFPEIVFVYQGKCIAHDFYSNYSGVMFFLEQELAKFGYFFPLVDG